MSVVLTTETEVDISRGDILCHPNNQPHVEVSLMRWWCGCMKPRSRRTVHTS